MERTIICDKKNTTNANYICISCSFSIIQTHIWNILKTCGAIFKLFSIIVDLPVYKINKFFSKQKILCFIKRLINNEGHSRRLKLVAWNSIKKIKRKIIQLDLTDEPEKSAHMKQLIATV